MSLLVAEARLAIDKHIGAFPRIAKNEKMTMVGEYKIRPYKGFPGERKGEPCVHPVFSDSLLVSEKNKDLSESPFNLLITAAEKIAVLKSKNSRSKNQETAM